MVKSLTADILLESVINVNKTVLLTNVVFEVVYHGDKTHATK